MDISERSVYIGWWRFPSIAFAPGSTVGPRIYAAVSYTRAVRAAISFQL